MRSPLTVIEYDWVVKYFSYLPQFVLSLASIFLTETSNWIAVLGWKLKGDVLFAARRDSLDWRVLLVACFPRSLHYIHFPPTGCSATAPDTCALLCFDLTLVTVLYSDFLNQLLSSFQLASLHDFREKFHKSAWNDAFRKTCNLRVNSVGKVDRFHIHMFCRQQ